MRTIDEIHRELSQLREWLQAEEQLRDTLVGMGFAQPGAQTNNMPRIKKQIQSRLEELKRLGAEIRPDAIPIPASIQQALQVLGLPTNSFPSQEQLKNAYRKLAKKHHPDCGGNARKMQEINRAYDAVNAKGRL